MTNNSPDQAMPHGTGKLHDYVSQLSHQSRNLRSVLTSILLYLDQENELSENEKECISSICDQINKKNNELLYTESLLNEVLRKFSESKRPK